MLSSIALSLLIYFEQLMMCSNSLFHFVRKYMCTFHTRDSKGHTFISNLNAMKRKSITETAFSGAIIFSLFLVACTKTTAPTAAKESTLNNSNPVVASTTGIGVGSGNNFNFSDVRDLAVPFDFNSSGFASQLICYRPGASTCWIFANVGTVSAPVFNYVYKTSSGIGVGSGNNYNLNDNRDRIIPYDCNGTGKLDHIICYRPGTGAFWIFKNSTPGGTFTHILSSGTGVGSFNLSDDRDLIVPFDFYSTGKATELLCYRPGTGICYIMHNNAAVGSTPNFVSVFTTTTGIGTSPYNFDLSDNRDLILPFDLGNTGKLNGIICYRPGAGVIYTYTHSTAFSILLASSHGITSTGGSYPTADYDLSSNTDRIIPYDYFGNGQINNIVAYRPGVGPCYMFTSFSGEGYCQYLYSNGIGSGSNHYDLHNTNDKVFAYDCDGSGKINHLVCYRPGSGAFWVFNNSLVQIY